MDFRRVFTSGERLRYGYYQTMDHFFGRERSFRWHEKSRRKFYNKLHQRLKDEGVLGKTTPIPRVKGIGSKELKKNYINKGIPVVVEGGAKDWACVKEWSLDYFKEKYGEEEIILVDHEAIEAGFERLSLSEVIDGIREKNGKYYRFYPLLQRHPEHIKDFDYDWLLKARQKPNYDDEFEVFIGGEGTVTPFHNAFSSNLFTQVYGQKEWVIYPPYYTAIFDPDPAQNVYRSTSSRQGGMYSPFDDSAKDHPLFKYMDGMHTVLNPGDVLYNPPYWWHTVRNTSDSIGVGYRWFPLMHCWWASPLYFSLDLCATNPSIWKSLRLIQTDTNLIHLAQTGKLDAFLAEEKAKKESWYHKS